MSALPEIYRYLDAEKGPRILNEMLSLYGTHEVPGMADSPTIIAWAKELGPRVGMDYSHDSLPWCGLAVGIAALRAGFTPPDICVRASSWDGFGVQAGLPMLGDILRFEREGGGHVGIYVGQDAFPIKGVRCFHVLGGNQADQVNIVRIDKARLHAVRRCPYQTTPANVRQIYLDASGHLDANGVISANES